MASVKEHLAAELRLHLGPFAERKQETGGIGAAAASVSGSFPFDAYRFDGAKLLNPEELDRLLRVVGETLGTKKPAVAASLFFKHYSRALSGAFYAWVQADIALDLELNQLELFWLPAGKLLVRVKQPQGWSTAQAESKGTSSLPVRLLSPGDDGRSASSYTAAVRERFALSLFARNLSPLLQLLSERTHLKKEILWENTVIYMHAIFQNMASQSETALQRSLIREELSFWTKHAPGSWFGEKEAAPNPLDIRGCQIEHPIEEGATVRVRERCCLKVLTGGSNCTTCPRISETQREALFHKKKGV